MIFVTVIEAGNVVITERSGGGAWLLGLLRQGPGHFSTLRVYKVYKLQSIKRESLAGKHFFAT